MPAEYCVEKADVGRDRAEILAVINKNEVVTEAPRKIAWLLENNPFGKGSCWLLIHVPSGSVVGIVGLAARRMKVVDSVERVGRAGFFAGR